MDTSSLAKFKADYLLLPYADGVYRIHLPKRKAMVELVEDDIVLICRYPKAQIAYVVVMARPAFKKRFLVKQGPIYSRTTMVKGDALEKVRSDAPRAETGELSVYCRGEKARQIGKKFMDRFPISQQSDAGDEFQRGNVVDMDRSGVLLIDRALSHVRFSAPPFQRFDMKRADASDDVKLLGW